VPEFLGPGVQATGHLERLPLRVRLLETCPLVVQNALVGSPSSVRVVSLASLGVITPLTGAVAHTARALFVIANSSRLSGGETPALQCGSAPLSFVPTRTTSRSPCAGVFRAG
jgi:hypothetical protein